ncbi:unnamed protein product [Coregonus sp. 'balchen']|uniref:Uncharacterized protein n=1 Tax=Coregonus suidteri TaxID=861788 RepID=A0AAN8LTK4_9TELE|nr:unnamed protein product [Coregonus sp. 'balchen']
MASGPESGSSSVHSINISAQNGASVNAPITVGNTIGAIHYHTGDVPSPAASQHTSPSSGHDFLKTHKSSRDQDGQPSSHP